MWIWRPLDSYILATHLAKVNRATRKQPEGMWSMQGGRFSGVDTAGPIQRGARETTDQTIFDGLLIYGGLSEIDLVATAFHHQLIARPA